LDELFGIGNKAQVAILLDEEAYRRKKRISDALPGEDSLLPIYSLDGPISGNVCSPLP
jgi:hypothetical protein